MPIFDNNRTKINIRKSRLNLEVFTYEKEKISKERQLYFTKAKMDLHAAREELNALTASYKANKLNFEALNERYKIGLVSSIDLFKALTDFNIAEFKIITAKYSTIYKNEILKVLNKEE